MSTEDEQHAAMTAWLAENSRPWHPHVKGWDEVAEERMAHVSNGGTLRAVPAGRAMRVRFRRGAPDDQGYVSDDGVHINRWEPDAGDVA